MKNALLLLLFVISSALAARILYVQSPAAKLLSGPALNTRGVRIAKGTAVNQIGRQGLFLQVRGSSGTGWLLKLFVGPAPPGKRLDVGASVDRTSSVRARARASQFSQTAAARGLVESKNMRARGDASEFDFSAIEWLERRDVTKADLRAFVSEGGLAVY